MSYAGKNLKYIRKQREWTQEEMANQLQIKRSLVGAYEEERAEHEDERVCEIEPSPGGLDEYGGHN